MSTDRESPERRGDVEHSHGDLGWSLGLLLRAYQEALSSAVDGLPHGYRGYQVLSAVVHDEQPNQLSLAARLGIDRTVMTYLIDDLVGAGLVERRLNPSDRRQRRIVATPGGEQTLTEVEGRVGDAERSILAALGEEDRHVLCTLIRRAACGVLHTAPEGDPCAVVADALAHSTAGTPVRSTPPRR